MANIVRKTIEPELVVSNSWLARKSTFAKLECGHLAFVCDEHHPELVKSEYPCEACGDIETHKAKIAEWLKTGRVMYTRARLCYSTKTYDALVYGRDEKSPTGVILLGSVPDIPELHYFLTGSNSPLSPTER